MLVLEALDRCQDFRVHRLDVALGMGYEVREAGFAVGNRLDPVDDDLQVPVIYLDLAAHGDKVVLLELVRE